MNKVFLTILVFFIFEIANATDFPPRCSGNEATYNEDNSRTGLSMPSESYKIISEPDHEFEYVKISVPSSYGGLPISQINLKRIDSGSLVLTAGLAHEIVEGNAITKSIFLSPSEINSVSFNVVYASYQKCKNGNSYLKESIAYDLGY